ncbi:hypothetical protein ACTFIY_005686 [Dictyostelium cf. discoideum]
MQDRTFSMMTQIGCGYINMIFLSYSYQTSYQNPLIEKVEVDGMRVKLMGTNFCEVYCSSFEIQLFASQVPSNKMKLIYPSVLNNINSIPGNKNGTITIIESNSIVTLNVDGISNTNNLYFNYDRPYISSYSISNEVLTLYGQCFGREDSFTIYNDEIPVSFNNVKNNEQETIMSFTIPKTLNYVNLSIKSYENKSNSIFIGLSFMSKFVDQPLVNGSNCIVKLYNASVVNNLENPVLSIYSNSNEEFKSIGTIKQNYSNDIDYLFFIGIGLLNDLIICTGEFNNQGFYDKTTITISNQTMIPIIVNSNEIKTKKEPFFTSVEINVGCCGIFSNIFTLTVQPTIKKAISAPFNYGGGTVFISGENFHPEQLVSLDCDGDNFGCNYLNYSFFSCDVKTNDDSTINNYQRDQWSVTIFGYNFYTGETTLLINGEKRCKLSMVVDYEIICMIHNDTLSSFFLPMFIIIINTTSEIKVIINQKVDSSMFKLILENISSNGNEDNGDPILIVMSTVVPVLGTVSVLGLCYLPIWFFKIPHRFFMNIKRETLIAEANKHAGQGDEYLERKVVHEDQRKILLDIFDNDIMGDRLSKTKNNNRRRPNSKINNNNNNNSNGNSNNNDV